MGKGDIPALTGIRFVPALLVMLAHGATMGRTGHFEALGALGNASMSLFFVLSGFILVYNYQTLIERPAWSETRRFLVARVARIYPAYLLIMAAGLLLSTKQVTSGGLLAHLALVQSWFTFDNAQGVRLIDQIPFMPPAWSISTEWFFYAAFPVLCVTLFQLRGRAALLGAVVAIGAQLLAGSLLQSGWTGAASTIDWLTYLSPYLRIAEFAAGGLLARYAMGTAPPRLGGALLAGSILLFAALIAAFSAPDAPEWLRRLRVSGAYVVPALALVLYCYWQQPRWLEHPLAVFAGEISYSFYLFHVATLAGIAKLWRGAELPTALPVMLVLALAINFALASASYAVIEKPARRFIRSRWGGAEETPVAPDPRQGAPA